MKESETNKRGDALQCRAPHIVVREIVNKGISAVLSPLWPAGSPTCRTFAIMAYLRAPMPLQPYWHRPLLTTPFHSWTCIRWTTRAGKMRIVLMIQEPPALF